MTTVKNLPQHVQQAMQRAADIAGTDISNVDPTPFLDMPAPVDDSSLARMARQRQAYNEAAAANRAESELAELKATAAADLPGREELSEMARRYGVSAEALLAEYARKKTEAQEALNAHAAAIEATRKAAARAAAEIRLAEAIAQKNYSTVIQFGEQSDESSLRAIARAKIVEVFGGWDWKS